MTLVIALLLAQAHPCMTDAQKLCPDVKAGQGRVAACLKEHKDQLSAECKAKIAEFREGAQSCQADVQRLCPGAKPGPERQKCMREHKDQISQECRELFEQRMEKRGGGGPGPMGPGRGRGAMNACREDAQKLCKHVKPGEGRMMECLKQHQSELSQGCANQMGR